MSKTGRNEPCPCGSGKKYKKCCEGRPDDRSAASAEDKMYRPSNDPLPANRFVIQEGPLAGRWMPISLEKMSTEEIIGQFKEFGFEIDANKFMEDAKKFIDVESLVECWKKEYKISTYNFEEDFYYLGADELWKRLSPNDPSVELVQEWIMDGEECRDANETDEALEFWVRAWNGAKNIFLRAGKSVEEIIADHFDSVDFEFFDWLENFNRFLFERAAVPGGVENIRNFDLFRNEVHEFFPGWDGIRDVDLKIQQALVNFNMGNLREGDEAFEKLIAEYPGNSDVYYTWGASYHDEEFLGDREPDLCRAEKIYRAALADPAIYDKGDIYDSMQLLNEQRREEAPDPENEESKEAEGWVEYFTKMKADEAFADAVRIIESGKLAKYNEYFDVESIICDYIVSLFHSKKIEAAGELSQKLRSRCRALYSMNSSLYNECNFMVSLYRSDVVSACRFLDDEISSPDADFRRILKMIHLAVFTGVCDLKGGEFGKIIAKLTEMIKDRQFGEDDFDLRAELFQTIVDNDFEAEYLKIKNGGSFEAGKFEAWFADHKIHGADEVLKIAADELKREAPEAPGKEYIKGFIGERKGALEKLLFHFFRYMFEKFGIRFACSGIVWFGMLEYFMAADHDEGMVTPPDKYFRLDEDCFKKFLNKIANPSVKDDVPSAAALLWGSQYFYDFMAGAGYVGGDLCKRASDSIRKLKAKFVKNHLNEAWKFGFVHEWENARR